MADSRAVLHHNGDSQPFASTGSLRHSNNVDAANEREFYKFYQPYQELTRMEGNKEHGRDQQEEKRNTRASHDKSLAAFAQLGAIRLDARRAIISFYDRNCQYLLAEATQTTNLYDEKAASPDDELWLGTTVLERSKSPASVCEYALDVRATLEPGVGDGENEWDCSVFVIPDLAKDDQIRDKPYVRENPHLRFYAGVQIRSMTGYVIGTYSVLDDKPREGLSEADIKFMKHMAGVVMSHMECIRAKDEHRRAENMVRGLGAFVEGKSELVNWWMSDEAVKKGHNEDDGSKPMSEQRPQGIQRADLTKMQNEAFEAGSKEHQPSGSDDMEGTAVAEGSLKHSTDKDRPRDSVASTTAEKPEDIAMSSSLHSTFSRAAQLTCQAVEVEGTVFFDASVKSFGGLVEIKDADEFEIWDSYESSSGNHKPTSPDETIGEHHVERLEDKPANVFGWRMHDKGSWHKSRVPRSFSRMTEKFLHSMLWRHPRGKIFNLDTTMPPLKSLHPNDSAGSPENYSQSVHPPDPPARNERERRVRVRQREHEMRMLAEIFPGARSLAFVPMWDSHRNRWYAGSVMWTTTPIRLLHEDSELGFQVAFGHSIMAEIARLDTAMADKAKADVLSSISHELRSPLHGILGSAEHLLDAGLDLLQEDLVRTIETCGRTLLDTVDHLLDYAKINNFGKPHKRSEKPLSRRNVSQTTLSERATPLTGMMSLHSDLFLPTITEEVLDTVFAGYNHASAPGTTESVTGRTLAGAPDVQSDDQHTLSSGQGRVRDVTVFFDVHDGTEWNFRTQAGAWRRIVMNICGNALKYTKQGFIFVKLEANPTDKPGQSMIVFTVTDSGKGMSKDYIETRLFTPFAQEDPLTPGTGLGLSIVRQIVSSMGGTITVSSEAGRGTEIKVQIQMEHAPFPDDPSKQPHIYTVRPKSSGVKVGFVDGEESTEQSVGDQLKKRTASSIESVVIHLLRRHLKDWFNADLEIIHDPRRSDSKVVVMSERKASKLQQQMGNGQEHAILVPTIVLCENILRARDFAKRNQQAPVAPFVDYIAQPFGPHKLARALEACLLHPEKQPSGGRQDEEQGDTSEEDPDMPMPEAPEASLAAPPSGLPQDKAASSVADLKEEVVQVSQERSPSQRFASMTLEQGGSQPAASSSQERRPTPNPLKRSRSSRHLRVLLVDDNSINLNLLATYMKKNGHAYQTAGDGLEALEIFRQVSENATSGTSSLEGSGRASSQPPKSPNPAAPSSAFQLPSPFDFIFMDISMPRMDGLESTRHIRAHERALSLRSTTIIALTGLASASAQQEAFSSGIDLFLTKPVRLKELGSILDGGERTGNS